MKQYTDEEIVAYARSHVRNIDQQKGKPLVLGFMAIATFVVIGSLVSLYFEKCKKSGGNLFEDLNFLTGFGFGVGSVLFSGICVLCFLQMYARFYGKEIAAYRLLVQRCDSRGLVEKKEAP